MRNFIHYMFCVIGLLWLFWSLYNLAKGRGVSHSLVMWLRVISLRVLQPLSAILSAQTHRVAFEAPFWLQPLLQQPVRIPLVFQSDIEGGMLLVLSMVSSSYIWWMEKVWCLQISLRLQAGPARKLIKTFWAGSSKNNLGRNNYRK